MRVPIDNFIILSDKRLAPEEDKIRDCADLANSIRVNGLIQPIVCKDLGDNKFEIMVGRNRYRCFKHLLGYKELVLNKHFIRGDELDSLVAQLEENSHRKNFTPQEEALLIKDIHDEGIAKYGLSIQGGDGSGWSMNKTAKKIGRDKSFVSRRLLIANNLDLVQGCETTLDCYNTIKREKEKAFVNKVREKKIEILEKDFSEINKIVKNVHCSDALAFIKTVKDESIDFIHTDPPFAINYDTLIQTNMYNNEYEDDPETVIKLVTNLIPEFYRVLGKDKYIVMWFDFFGASMFRKLFEDVGFTVLPNPLVWFKLGTGGKTNRASERPGSVTQFAMLAWKDYPEITIKGKSNAHPFPVVRKNRIHHAQMPESLVEDIIKTYSYEGDLVLDTFSGSLSTLRACYSTKRRFTGCEAVQGNIDEGISYTMEWFDEKGNTDTN